MRKCSSCESPLRPESHRCKSCGRWTWDGVSDGADSDGETVLYEDITSAEVTRTLTGIIDDCLGGGIVLSDLVLLGGLPGSGKSTLVLQIAQAFCRIGECVYIAAEEDVKAIKGRGVRLGIETSRKLRFIPAMGGVANIGALLLRLRPKFIIIDSLDALTGRDHEEEISVLEAVKKYCTELQAPALVTSQVNKDGDYSGLMAKQHAVDVLLTLGPDADERTENGEALRVLETLKNRSGRAFVQSVYEMTAGGLVLSLREPENDPEEDGSEEDGSEEDGPLVLDLTLGRRFRQL